MRKKPPFSMMARVFSMFATYIHVICHHFNCLNFHTAMRSKALLTTIE